MSPRFHTREAEAGNGEFVIPAFDSVLPYLASIGSEEQWGLVPFSQRDGGVVETLQQVKDAETYRLTGKGDALCIFIVEAEMPEPGDDIGSGTVRLTKAHPELLSQIKPEDGTHMVSVGLAFARENWIPKYIVSQDHISIEDIDKDSYVYIEVMIAHHRIGSSYRTGSGAAFIRSIRDFGLKNQRRTLFIDGWAGNGKKLIGFGCLLSAVKLETRQTNGDFTVITSDKASGSWATLIYREKIRHHD